MSSNNLFYCQNCQRHLNIKSKEEYLQHRETTCNKMPENYRDTDSNTSGYNIASFTFGGKHSDGLKDIISPNKVQEAYNKGTGNFNSNMKSKKNFDREFEEIEENPNLKQKLFGIGIINKLGHHNSFVSSIIQIIWNMKHLRNYLLSEVILSDETKHSLLINLRVS